MPRDENGVYTPLRDWEADATASPPVPFSPEKWNDQDQDFAQALNDLPLASWTPRHWPAGTDPMDPDVNPGGIMFDDGVVYICTLVEPDLKVWIDVSSPGAAAVPTGGTTGQVLAKASDDDGDYDWQTLAGTGDMVAAVYDPQEIEGDTFDRSNHTGSQAISTVTGLQAALDGKAASSHNHDDRYYTEGEVDSLLSGKANSSHGIHVPTGGSTGQVLKKASGSDGDLTWAADNVGEGGGGGDMFASVYDPQEIEADAFDQDNMVDGTTNKNFTATEQTKLAGIEAGADVTNPTNVASAGALMSSGLGSVTQAYDADLAAIAALTPTNDDIIQRKSGAWTNRSIAQLLTDLGLGSIYQPLDSDLTSIAALTTQSFGRGLLELANLAAARATLKIVTISEASYEALDPPDSDTLYFITDAE